MKMRIETTAGVEVVDCHEVHLTDRCLVLDRYEHTDSDGNGYGDLRSKVYSLHNLISWHEVNESWPA